MSTHRRQKMKKDIRLGEEVRDVITGFKGVAISKISYLTGCVQYGVKPKAKNGKMLDVEYIDEDQLEPIIKRKREASKTPLGGDQPDRPKKSW